MSIEEREIYSYYNSSASFASYIIEGNEIDWAHESYVEFYSLEELLIFLEPYPSYLFICFKGKLLNDNKLLLTKVYSEEEINSYLMFL